MSATDAAGARRALRALAAEVHGQAVVVTTLNTAHLQTAIKRHAAQPRTNPRPRGATLEGPRLLTGTYNRSLNRRVDAGATRIIGTVGTNDVRARRLEFGGARSLAYPHFGPGLDEIAPRYIAALRAIPDAAARRTRGVV